MSELESETLSYSEFKKRRDQLIHEIGYLKQKQATILDPAYTTMAPNGITIVELQLQNTRERLTHLVAAWELQERRRRRP